MLAVVVHTLALGGVAGRELVQLSFRRRLESHIDMLLLGSFGQVQSLELGRRAVCLQGALVILDRAPLS